MMPSSSYFAYNLLHSNYHKLYSIVIFEIIQFVRIQQNLQIELFRKFSGYKTIVNQTFISK